MQLEQELPSKLMKRKRRSQQRVKRYQKSEN
jgi:hypothetical protein